jgi:hypothetical protein
VSHTTCLACALKSHFLQTRQIDTQLVKTVHHWSQTTVMSYFWPKPRTCPHGRRFGLVFAVTPWAFLVVARFVLPAAMEEAAGSPAAAPAISSLMPTVPQGMESPPADPHAADVAAGRVVGGLVEGVGERVPVMERAQLLGVPVV